MVTGSQGHRVTYMVTEKQGRKVTGSRGHGVTGSQGYKVTGSQKTISTGSTSSAGSAFRATGGCSCSSTQRVRSAVTPVKDQGQRARQVQVQELQKVHELQAQAQEVLNRNESNRS